MAAKKANDLRIIRGEESRRSLIDATISAVAQYGLSATTLNAVAEIAGVSRTLVGFHFSSKEQLLDAALASALNIYDSSLKVYLAKMSNNPAAQISGHLSHDMHFAATHRDLLSLWFANWGEVRATKKYRLSLLPIDHKYRDEIAKNLELILVDKDKAEHTGKNIAKQGAIILDSFIYGVWLECHLNADSFNLEQYLQIAESLHSLVIKSND